MVCAHRAGSSVEEILAEQPIFVGKLYFKVEASEQAYSYYVASEPGMWRTLAENVDGRIVF
jgi:hypothetical protein